MKRTILIVALSVAFAAVSLWLILSGGRSKRATSLKYRLGGMLIGLTALASTACESSGGFMQSCYDPAPPPFNISPTLQLGDITATDVRNGDVLGFMYEYWTANYKALKFVITDMENRELQTETFDLIYGEEMIELTVEVGEFTGEAELSIYKVLNNGNEELWEVPYKLNIVAAEEE